MYEDTHKAKRQPLLRMRLYMKSGFPRRSTEGLSKLPLTTIEHHSRTTNICHKTQQDIHLFPHMFTKLAVIMKICTHP